MRKSQTPYPRPQGKINGRHRTGTGRMGVDGWNRLRQIPEVDAQRSAMIGSPRPARDTMKTPAFTLSRILTHLLAVAVGGAVAWQGRPVQIEPTAAGPSTSSRDRPASGQVVELLPANRRYGKNWGAENRAREMETAGKVAAITDFPAEMSRLAALQRDNAFSGEDYDYFAAAFDRWLEEDSAAALEWLGGEELGWSGFFYQKAASGFRHVGLTDYLAAIRKWPAAQQVLALKAFGGANPEEVLPLLRTADERRIYLEEAIEKAAAGGLQQIRRQLSHLDAAERAALLEKTRQRINSLSTDGSGGDDAALADLATEPALADAVAGYRRKRELARIEELAATDPAGACRELRSVLEAASAPAAEIDEKLTQLRARSFTFRDDPVFYNALQAVRLGDGDAGAALLDHVRRGQAAGRSYAPGGLLEIARVAIPVDPESTMKVLVELTGREQSVRSVQWGLGNSAEAGARMHAFLAGTDYGKDIEAKIGSPDTESEIYNYPAAGFFAENEAGALAWARALPTPKTRDFALRTITAELRAQGRTAEAAVLETEAKEAAK